MTLAMVRYSIIRRGVDSSSEDDPTQSISNTLSDDPTTFWSSKGSDDINSSEYLVFQFTQAICIVKSVEILIFKARFQMESPIYGPQRMQISVGFSPKLSEMEYVSPVFDVNNNPEPQEFDIGNELVFGSYIRLDLFGRNSTQHADDLYYTVLERVKVYGTPIGAMKKKAVLTSSILRNSIGKETFIHNLLAIKDQQHSPGYRRKKKPKLEAQHPYPPVSLSLSLSLEEQELLKAAEEYKNSGDEEAFYWELKTIFQSRFASSQKNIEEKVTKQRKVIRLLRSGVSDKLIEAVDIIIASDPSEELRTKEFWSFLAKASEESDFELCDYYLINLMDTEKKLNEHETKYYVLEALKKASKSKKELSKTITQLTVLLRAEAITATEDIGDSVKEYSNVLALEFYNAAVIPCKVIYCLMELQEFSILKHYCTQIDFVDLLPQLLTDAKQKFSYKKTLEFALVLVKNNPGDPVVIDPELVAKILGIDVQNEWDTVKRIEEEYEKTEEDKMKTEESETGCTVA